MGEGTNMKPSTIGLLLVGIVMVLIGFAGLSGTLALSLSNSAVPGNGAQGVGVPAFNYTVNNLTVGIISHNALPGCVTTTFCPVSTVKFSFGDGVNVTSNAPGSHTYSKAGSYLITDTIRVAYTAAYAMTTTATSTVTVPNTGTGGGGTQSSISPSFVVKTTGCAALFTDTSTATGVQKVTAVTFGFGDGKTASGAAGFSNNHTYGQAGVYAVQETVTGSTSSAVYYAFGNVTLNSCSMATQSNQAVAPPTTTNVAMSIAIGDGLVFGGVVIGILAFVPIPSVYRIPIVLVVGAVVFVIGYALGGGFSPR